MNNLKEFINQYKWLIDEFQKKFGKKNILFDIFDYDNGFAIAINNGKKGSLRKRTAMMLEYEKDICPSKKIELMTNEDGIKYNKNAIWEHISFDKFKDKKERLNNIIREIKIKWTI